MISHRAERLLTMLLKEKLPITGGVRRCFADGKPYIVREEMSN